MLQQQLPATEKSPSQTVLACGAWLKNTACILHGESVIWSALHGDLGDPLNCILLERSVENLVARVDTEIEMVAHDLHPDFFSTHLALQVAQQLDVPALAVQHHHAHIGAVMAEYGLQEPVIGLALDGVGLGTDGVAWGGELLWVERAAWQRLGHLQALPLPGADAAAREPWRMAAAGLHVLERDAEITQRFSGEFGVTAARTVQSMLKRGINSPLSTSAGRWFDAVAGALGICSKQTFEAEAAIALEKMAETYLAQHGEPEHADDYVLHDNGVLDLRPLLITMFALADSAEPQAVARAAAVFHLSLVNALADWVAQAARQHHTQTIALGGGCFFNRILSTRLRIELTRRGMKTYLPAMVSCGDAGLALGQAWVARQQW
ncbi:MAG: carbamoyltransferase HypF [Burkholderiaceae bacterium]|nr:carbamoyltransferase HypF [Burkholderiaceae bacterium]